MHAPAAQLAMAGTHGAPLNAPALDDELMEALGYFSEEVAAPARVSSSHSPLADSSEDVDSMLLSLDIHELLPSGEEDQVDLLPQNDRSPQQQEQQLSPKKVDRRRRPNSTAKRRNRRRPKHELEYLRAKVAELQEELATLGKADVVEPNALAKVIQAGLTRWRHIAERQRLEVNSSVAENRQLRSRLMGQLQVARALEAAVDQQHKETGSATIGCGVRPIAMNMTDQQIFAQLNLSLDAQLAEVPTVLTTKALSNVLHRLTGGLQFQREAGSTLFRHEEARMLPFSVSALHNAIWNCLHNGAVVARTRAQLLTQDHSNLIFCETLELPQARWAHITKRAAFRRHFEADRVVFVWNSYVEIDGSVFVRLREKGWSSCSTFEYYRGVAADASSAGNFVRGCMARMAVELTPEVAACRSEREALQHLGEMTDLIVGTYHHNFGLIHKVVENVLCAAGTK
jgi:hypothetical protein